MVTASTLADIRVAERSRRRATRGTRWLQNGVWYVVLTVMAVITVFPFAWMFLTSIKGPADAITSVPPQFLPNDPTLAAYHLDLTQEEMLGAPSFAAGEEFDWGDRSREVEIHNYYRVPPYWGAF